MSVHTSQILKCIVTTALMLFVGLANAQPPAVAVDAITLKSQPFAEKIEALGTLKAKESVDITSIVTEIITRIHFEDGQRVRKGDMLVEMDSNEEKALRLEELSRVSDARRQVKRLESLVKQNTASQSALDEQKLALQTAQARMEAIEQQIKHRTITAPFDGVVGLRNISVGALSQPGVLITTVDDDSVMKLDFSIPETYFSYIRPGQTITAKTRAWPDQAFVGEVSSVDSRVNPSTRAIQVRALLPNNENKLRPGMLMRVDLEKSPRETLLIPEEALITRADQHLVWVAASAQSPSKVIPTPVIVGERIKGFVEIVDGLSEGQILVTRGTLKLRPGSMVTLNLENNLEEDKTHLNTQAAPEVGAAQ